jgi:ring-1,2-phenylacetyl-CoA epoxidase subunit PaaC
LASLVEMDEKVQNTLLEIADDELILGWRDSEWTGIAPLLEEDVAFSSIAQNEIGHARALYELVARERGTTADELAFDRPPEEYRCAPLVELRLLDWEKTIARHYLYEQADAIRLERLMQSGEPEIAGLATKIDREEAYHRIHAQMWFDRLQGEPRFTSAVEELWLLAQAILDDDLRPLLAKRTGLSTESGSEPQGRGAHTDELPALWEEMTMVRRSQPAGTKW